MNHVSVTSGRVDLNAPFLIFFPHSPFKFTFPIHLCGSQTHLCTFSDLIVPQQDTFTRAQFQTDRVTGREGEPEEKQGDRIQAVRIYGKSGEGRKERTNVKQIKGAG